ncbi:FAD-dependent oxidoreductase [Glutamicibacter soli]|uniref:FAD-dependent oxidoreductase n=1 Tax=Glutamicibacter soli TaxID=453836 RepID=A0A6L9FZS8_9MICC|nr:FAD-dependent oxidoreductase [Glutamicibacter soli]NAZ15021.1 FAD-dependent oxidoreductase [Glutamicibacter soli]
MSAVHIIGAGVAGYTLARELVSRNYAGTISISDAQGLPYDRPPLSKSLQAEPFAPVSWYRDHRINLVQEEITELPVPTAEDDWVVLATGTIPRTLDVPGAEFARSLHTAADAQHLAGALDEGMFGQRVLIIGAGLVGAEFASTARMLGAQVTLVSRSNAPLARVLGEDLAEQLHAEHRTHGVTTISGVVTELGPDYAIISGVRHEADIIVAAIGVEPDTALAERSGLDVENGILVDAGQRSTSHRQVLALGDAAREAGQPRAVHWEAAMEDAAIAASTILGTPAPARSVPWFWSDRHDAHVETVGDFYKAGSVVKRHNRQGRIQTVFGMDESGALVAASMIDGGLMSKAVRKLITRGITPGIEQLEDPQVGPRELGRSAP